MPIFKCWWLPLLVLLLSACQTQPDKNSPVKAEALAISDIAKSDVDMVAEVTLRHGRSYLKRLAEKLYRRNPVQLQRATGRPTLEQAMARLFPAGRWEPGVAELQGRRAAEAIGLALDEAYQGDRVAAFVAGLLQMQLDAFGGKEEFFFIDSFDPQKLYYLARNVEIASWRLRSAQDESGRLLLLSTGADSAGVTNASFERLFGKVIALYDHMAQVVADTTNRQIKNVVQGVASAVFFPI